MSAREQNKRTFDENQRKEIIRIIDGRVGHRWGDFVETLVRGGLIKLLNDRDIKVERSYKKEEGTYQLEGETEKRDYEFDVVAKNGEEVVIAEVKTDLSKKDVHNFLETLTTVVPTINDYKNLKIYGAIGYLNSSEKAEKISIDKGLFVIQATGNSARITNPKDFKPTNFSQSRA